MFDQERSGQVTIIPWMMAVAEDEEARAGETEVESEADGRDVAGGVFAEGAEFGIWAGGAVGRQREVRLYSLGGTRREIVAGAGEGYRTVEWRRI